MFGMNRRRRPRGGDCASGSRAEFLGLRALTLRVSPTIRHSQMNHFKAIAAMALNRTIGAGNRIPWHLPEELRWFKKITMGNVIVMGRRTFESIGRLLPNRETVVLSRSQFAWSGVRTVSDLSEIDLVTESREVFICGGAQLYEAALPLCSDLYLTLVKRIVAGDTFFPRFEDRFVLIEEIMSQPEFKILRYRNAQIHQID